MLAKKKHLFFHLVQKMEADIKLERSLSPNDKISPNSDVVAWTPIIQQMPIIEGLKEESADYYRLLIHSTDSQTKSLTDSPSYGILVATTSH